MDIYHIWCNLKPGIKDLEFVTAAESFLNQLKASGTLGNFRIGRRKLGLGPASLGEFHLQLEFENLDALDRAFSEVSSRRDPVESFHHAVNSKVCDLTFALYRDFPDSQRYQGQEKF